jgi:hypothetical protein
VPFALSSKAYATGLWTIGLGAAVGDVLAAAVDGTAGASVGTEIGDDAAAGTEGEAGDETAGLDAGLDAADMFAAASFVDVCAAQPLPKVTIATTART